MAVKTKERPLTKEEFKAIRLHLGETQEEFAKRLGYKTPVTIAFKEAGTKKITASDEIILRQWIPTVRTRKVA